MSTLELPEHLVSVAYTSGQELAWKQEDCAKAIDWLRQNSYAILGTELWLIEGDGIRTAIRTDLGPAIYVTSCNPIKGESWTRYVDRCAEEAAKITSGFHWPEDASEPQRPVHFNLCWADREWFRKSGEYDAHLADE